MRPPDHVQAVTAAVAPNVLRAGLLFTAGLVFVALSAAFLLSLLPDRYAFWKSPTGIAVVEVAVAVAMVAGFLPALLIWCSQGRITLDSTGMRWTLRGQRGQIVWDRPYTIRRWAAVATFSQVGETGPPYPQDYPVVVYEVSQGATSIRLWRGISWGEAEKLPKGELQGVMLFLRARRLTNALDSLMR